MKQKELRGSFTWQMTTFTKEASFRREDTTTRTLYIYMVDTFTEENWKSSLLLSHWDDLSTASLQILNTVRYHKLLKWKQTHLFISLVMFLHKLLWPLKSFPSSASTFFPKIRFRQSSKYTTNDTHLIAFPKQNKLLWATIQPHVL